MRTNWLCTKCYQNELSQIDTILDEDLTIGIQELHIDNYSYGNDGKDDVEDSPNLIEESRSYCIKKLNEAFTMFGMEPVVP